MMLPQILGMRYYVTGSWQNCLNELTAAIQVESMLIAGGNSPTLIYARSSELLAMHLLIIYDKYREQSVSIFVINRIKRTIRFRRFGLIHPRIC